MKLYRLTTLQPSSTPISSWSLTNTIILPPVSLAIYLVQLLDSLQMARWHQTIELATHKIKIHQAWISSHHISISMYVHNSSHLFYIFLTTWCIKNHSHRTWTIHIFLVGAPKKNEVAMIHKAYRITDSFHIHKNVGLALLY